MLIKNFFRQATKLFNPFARNVAFYTNYLTFIQELQTNPKYIDYFKVFQWSILVKSLHLFYLYFNPFLTPFDRLVHYDIETNLIGSYKLNSDGAVIFFMFYALNHYFYSKQPPSKNNDLLRKILVGQGSSFFLLPPDLTQLSYSVLVQRQLLLFFNVCQSFLLLCELLVPISVLLLLIPLISDETFLQESLLIKCYHLVIFFISVFLFQSSLCFYAHALSRLVSIGATQLGVLKMKCRQIKNFLELNSTEFDLQNHYFFYWRATVELFRLFAEYNSFYGRLFFVYLAANLPTNVYITTFLLFGDLQWLGRIYVAAFASTQIFSFIAVHYYFVQFSYHFHAPSFVVQQCFLKISNKKEGKKHERKSSDFRKLLAMSNSIEAMCTTRPYGITYHRFGNCTLQTFGKVRITFLNKFKSL